MAKNNKRKGSEDRPLQVNGASQQVTDFGGGEKMNNLNDRASMAPEELVGRLTEIEQMLLRVKTSYLDANQEFSGLRAQLEQIQIQKQELQNERDTLLRELDGLKAITEQENEKHVVLQKEIDELKARDEELAIQKKSLEEELALLTREKENILELKREEAEHRQLLEAELALLTQEKEKILELKREEAEHRQLLEDEKKAFGEKQKELLEKVAELEQKRVEAEEHELALRVELDDLQKSRNNYSERVLDFQNEIEMLRKENAAILTQREDEINRFQDLTHANTELTQQLDAYKRDLDESMRMLLEVEQKSNALIEDMNNLSEKNKQLEQNCSDLQALLDKNSTHSGQEFESLEKAKVELEQERDWLTNEIKRLEAAIELTLDKQRSLEQEKMDLQLANDTLTASVTALEQEKNSIQQEKTLLNGQTETLTARLNELETQKQQLEQERNDLSERAQFLEGSLAATEKRFKTLEGEMELLLQSGKNMNEEYQKLQEAMEKLQEEKTTLLNEKNDVSQRYLTIEHEQAELLTAYEQIQNTLVETQSILRDREEVIHNLNQRIKVLSDDWKVPLPITFSNEGTNYEKLRVQMLVETILPNLYKKRLILEVDMINNEEEEKGEELKKALTDIKYLVNYHEQELQQLLEE